MTGSEDASDPVEVFAMRPNFVVFIAFAAAAAGACGEDPWTASSSRSAVYGTDERADAALHPRRELGGIAKTGVLALVPRGEAEEIGEGRWPEVMPSLGELLGLCPGEAFAEQPVLATCTGVLIADDLVLTARHCVDTEETCRAMGLVFDFALDERGILPPLDAADVFTCAELVTSGGGEAREDDFALVRLDRAAGPDRAPVPLRPEGLPLAEGDPVAVIGHPSGLPAKIDDGGRVRADLSRRATYRITSDTFAGSSGSAVLDAGGRLAGIVSGGAPDYETAGGCTRAIVYGEDEGREVVVPIDRVREVLGRGAAGCACARGRPRDAGFAAVLLSAIALALRLSPRPRPRRAGRADASHPRLRPALLGDGDESP